MGRGWKSWVVGVGVGVGVGHNPPQWAIPLTSRHSSLAIASCNYFQTHGTAMGTKMAVFFANIFMAEVDTDITEPKP